MKKVFIAITFFALLFWGGQLMAQENLNLSITNFVNDDYPRLRFEVTPKNNSGVPIDQLSADSFDFSDDTGSLEATVEEVVANDEPIAVMLVLDASGSMQQSGRFNELKAQAIAFQKTLSPFDQIGVLFFNVEADGSRVELFGTPDEREFVPSLDGGGAINFINQFSAGDLEAGAPLYDAMFRSVQVLARDSQSERRAVIVVTDSIDHAQGEITANTANGLGSIHADMEIVIERAQQENIPIFTIGLAVDQNEEGFSGVNAVELTKIGLNTGGTEAIEQSITNTSALMSAIANRLKTKYKVETEALTPPDNQEHELEITVESKADTATELQTFRALYPHQPLIELSYIDNEGVRHDDPQYLTEGIFGTVILQPKFFSRNEVESVEYFIDDTSIHTSTQPPFEYTVDISRYFSQVGAFTDFKIIATTKSPDVYVSEFEQDILILDCNLVCLAAENNFTTLDTNTFIAIWVALIFLVLLLVFFIIVSLVRRRQRRAEEALLAAHAAQAYAAGVYQYPMPVIPKTDEQVEVGPLPTANPAPPATSPAGDTIVDSSFTPIASNSGDNVPVQTASSLGSAGSYPATEVLTRLPNRLAFLLNPTNGQQHQLNSMEITIGRLPENQICLPDPAVSSKHAIIKFENDRYVIYDLGASNPVIVNGESLLGSHPLVNGDLVTIGREEWVFKELSS